jgi:hypothetical protein
LDFLPESPASGAEKRVSGFFRASGNQKSTFLHPRKFPPSGRVLCPFFNVQNAPTGSVAPLLVLNSLRLTGYCRSNQIACNGRPFFFFLLFRPNNHHPRNLVLITPLSLHTCGLW